MLNSQPAVRELYLARKRIASVVRKTPVVRSLKLSEQVGTSVFLKLENLQETGSFKLRGAANKILSLTAAERERGVITVSTGNHGRAVSYVARRLGVSAVICLSEQVPQNKIAALRDLGATVVIRGRSYDEAMAHAAELQEERGLVWVDPFDDPMVIAGQGTIGLELLQDLPELQTAIVPLSGGGLISGIALALKAADPGMRVIGVSMDRAPVMVHSLRAGRPVEMEEEPTLADALAGGIYLDNKHTFPLVQQLVDQTLLVSEEEIAAGIAFCVREHHLVVEGGGAVAVAALLHHTIDDLQGPVAVVISGGNLDSGLLAAIIRGEYQP